MKLPCLVTAVSSLASLVASTPIQQSIARTDNYDNNKIPLTAVDGTAGGYIYYNAFAYALQIAPSPPSGRYTITSGIRGQTLEGQPAFLPLNEKVKCFDMKSIRNACFATNAGVGGVPTSCTVQFSARSALTGKTFTKPAFYNPGLAQGHPFEPFNTTTFPSSQFSCVDRVDVSLIQAAVPGGGATVFVTLDDLSYVAKVTK